MSINDVQNIEQLQLELKKAQDKICELETKSRDVDNKAFFNLIDASPVPYALNDEEGNITYLNPAFTKNFGYDLNDIPKLEDWWPCAYPDVEYRKWVAETWNINLKKSKQT